MDRKQPGTGAMTYTEMPASYRVAWGRRMIALHTFEDDQIA